jgi:hypothetical protein
MKIRLAKDLQLIVTPESYVEQLALAAWSEKKGNQSLLIENYHDRQVPIVPPMMYWQHDETGRVCRSVLQPSERWFEITEEQYAVTAA